jgi:hypothetical protein
MAGMKSLNSVATNVTLIDWCKCTVYVAVPMASAPWLSHHVTLHGLYAPLDLEVVATTVKGQTLAN